MEILYGTGNKAKLASMQRALLPLNIKLLSLTDMNSISIDIKSGKYYYDTVSPESTVSLGFKQFFEASLKL